MAKKEVKTDLWVASQLDECGIQYTPQGSDVKEINEALSSASKSGTGNAGYPEYTAVVDDFVLVIEDKADTDKQIKLTDKGILDMSVQAVRDYALNGAYFYAKHIAQKSTFNKVFAIGVSGDAKHHTITPIYVDDREGYMELEPIESFTMFNSAHIYEYYTRLVLKEDTPEEKTTAKILQDAAELHEYLRTYGSLKDQDKPLVVSGILLALDEIKSGSFSLDMLTGDQMDEATDGDKICEAIKKRLKRSNVGPDAKRDKLMSEFAIIRTSARLNTVDDTLGKTPLKYYAEFLKEHVFDYIKWRSSSEDFIGRFYSDELKSRQWKPIFISSIFELVRGRENNMAMLDTGDTPLVSAKNGNNGLKGFVNTPKKVISGHCITLNNDGDGGAGLAYYQPANMALDTHVTALVPKIEMSQWTMLFISECLSVLHGFFGHGLSISNDRAKNIKIMLPVTDDGQPDYDFMEEFGRKMMSNKYNQYLAFLA